VVGGEPVPDLRERLFYPRAGWLSLVLLIVMALALSWAIQGAAWLDQLDFLPPVAFWALIAGALLGLLSASVVITLPAAACIGGAVVVWAVGGEYHPALDQVGRVEALRDDLAAWIIVVLRTGYPSQLSPYALGLGALMWSTAFMAAYAVYRHGRVIDAIVLLGAAMIINLSATFTDLFVYLLIFVLAALLLWLRAALVDRQDSWQRRRVNENLEVPAAIMRSGIVFAGASVVLAWLLTSVAVAAPLTGAWRSFDGVWTVVRDQFEGTFGGLTNPQSRITGNSFGSGFTVSGSWVSNDQEALTVAAPGPLYLRTASYDLYNGRGWERTPGTSRPVGAGDPLFDGPTPERPTEDEAFEIATITIQMQQTIGRNLFTAGAPLEIYAPVVIQQPAGLPALGGVEAANSIGAGEGYQLLVAISEATQAQLGAAGTDYPDVVTQLYLDTPGLTDRVAELAQDITALATNPYEQAEALARFLQRDTRFQYATEAPVPPEGEDLVDFFLFGENGRIGYCQYYASAMTMMARSLGLPARVAVGFAPGVRTADDTYLVREANAHAWAEIYFPGYGWQVFEATKTITPLTRVPGDPTSVLPPRLGVDPLGDLALDPALRGRINALPSVDFIEGGVDAAQPDAPDAADQARTGNGLLIAGAVLGAAIVVFLRMRHLRQRWRLLPAGDRAWQRLTLAAGRAGVGPRPSETIYEYTGWLEEQLPSHVEPIRAVADGKVWQAYSGRRMTHAASARLEQAWSRLRLPLIGLAVRRWLRGLVRRRG